MRNMFDMLLPNIFDILKSVFQSLADSMLTTNSGAEVQNHTITSQITNHEIHSFLARADHQSTNKSAHLISKMNQIISNMISMFFLH
jgi:hypothetical protein